MDALEAIMTRRSIRKFTDEPVSDERIEVILRAAMAAPSAGNQQPWRFVVVKDRAMMESIAQTTPYGAMLREAAFALVIGADVHDLKHAVMWEQDCSAATQNALLAIHAMGLGAVWLGFWPKNERVMPLKVVLGMPDGVEPMAVLAVGYPAEEKPAIDRYDAEKIRIDRWE